MNRISVVCFLLLGHADRQVFDSYTLVDAFDGDRKLHQGSVFGAWRRWRLMPRGFEQDAVRLSICEIRVSDNEDSYDFGILSCTIRSSGGSRGSSSGN